MHIFIDESGTFILSSAANNISLVGALVVPDRRLPYIEKRYSKIRAQLPKEKGEVKGRLMGENDIDLVVSMLAEHQVLFEACAIDLGTHSSEDLAWHKTAQEIGITKNLTEEFSPKLKESVFALRRRLEKLPYQLYVQSTVTFELIATVLNHSTMYFSQRIPKELEKFHWVIDGKERNQVTDWEDWWSQVVKPGLQAKSLRTPMPMFEEGDYRYFSRFDRKMPDYLRPHLKNPAEDGTDIGKILSESFRFSSNPECGLELVDILTNATRRALIGNLGKPGWKKIPRLMVHRGQHYIRMLAMMNHEPPNVSYPYMSVLRDFSRNGRDMLLPHFYTN
jgi:hypothetical protein